jgi:hypothetical protein
VITLDQAIDAGCVFLLENAAFDMYRLANAMAVSRATLYRVTTSQDRLLAEVLWRLAERALARARERRTLDGIEGVLEVVRHFSRQVLATRALRRFVDTEPETLTRVLADGVVHRRAIEATTAVFDECGLSRDSGLVDDPQRVGYLLVRIVESLCFAQVAGTRPDVDLTEQTIRGLLVQACTPRQRRRAPLRRLFEAAVFLAGAAVPELLAGDGRLPVVFS